MYFMHSLSEPQTRCKPIYIMQWMFESGLVDRVDNGPTRSPLMMAPGSGGSGYSAADSLASVYDSVSRAKRKSANKNKKHILIQSQSSPRKTELGCKTVKYLHRYLQ